jgi:hypothetical protein
VKYNESIIQAFTKYERTSDIEKETGLSRTTIAKYKKDPDLKQIVQQRRSETVTAAVALMQDYLKEGAEKLIQIINAPDTPAQVKLNGVQLLFNQCRDWLTTVDLQKRLEELESYLNDTSGQI